MHSARVNALIQERRDALIAEHGTYQNVPVREWNDAATFVMRNWYDRYDEAARIDEIEYRAKLKGTAARF